MTRSRATAIGLIGLVAGIWLSVGLPATAQIPLDEPLDQRSAARLDRMEKAMKELRAIVFQGRETGAPVVIQPADTSGQLGQMSDRVSALEQNLAKMTGELEVTRHDLDQSRQEATELRAADGLLKTQMAELQKNVQSLAPPPPPPPPLPLDSAPVAVAPAATGSDAAAAFAAAKGALAAGDMPSAEAGFRDYVDRHGDGPNGPEARYDLARALMARHAWAEAATSDIGAIRGWPRTRWAPDAVLDLSHALIALNKPADACQTLAELDRHYPKSGPTIAKRAGDLRLQAKCG